MKSKLDKFKGFQTKFLVQCLKCDIFIENARRNKSIRTCSICESKISDSANEFVYISFRKQLIENVKKNIDAILDYPEMRSNTDNISDIYDGRIYKEINTSTDKFPLCLTLNTDGVKVLNCGKNNHSLWPIQLIQNYLPPNLRYRTENVIVVGLYFGTSKIDFLSYMQPLVEEMSGLMDGFVLVSNNNPIYFQPFIIYCVVDLPAKSKLQGIVHCTGRNACGYCHHEGVAVKNPNTKSSTIRYIHKDTEPNLRTHESTMNAMININKNSCHSNGVQALSCMIGFKYFDLVRGFGLDDLHCCFKGVFEKILDLWYNEKYYKLPYHISKIKANILDERLQIIIYI